ncbi:hypothetical protein [Pantoea phage LIMEzero]|uniref:Tail fiber assembly protein n=1 Tax=Pantoea phage LIMEzero TaxID=943335 RepID=F4N9V0_9CAUD|nr:tail fiber assembly protein [Pantoea phage LIMEzero]CBY88578.1 hypothetical protein [Pantoea phage LIMEzero]
MRYFYSATTKGFYLDEISEPPTDAVEISEATWLSYTQPDEGKYLVWGDNGPTLDLITGES